MIFFLQVIFVFIPPVNLTPICERRMINIYFTISHPNYFCWRKKNPSKTM